MLDKDVIDKCLVFTKYDPLEAYVSDVIKNNIPLLIKFETEVWLRIRALGLEEAVAEYAAWDPYVKDYVIEEIPNFKSDSDCLISILRIIYYKKGDFSNSWVTL